MAAAATPPSLVPPAQSEQPSQPQPAPAAAPRSTGRSARYQALDLWRGLACMLLVVFHCGFYVAPAFTSGDGPLGLVASGVVRLVNFFWFGVPIFFVVSGYCIAASVDGLQRRPYSMTTFFTRRLRRIYPPLWVACAWAVVVTCAVALLWPTLYERCRQLPRLADFSVWNWVGNVCASESWQHHLTGSQVAFLMRNTWTLCFEEQFYVICGLLLAVAARRFFLGALVVTAWTLACRHGSRLVGLDVQGTFVEGHWLTFAAGILLFYQLNRASAAGRRWCSLVLVLGLAYAIVDRQFGASSAAARHVDGYIFVACGFALLLGWLRRFDERWAKASVARPFFWCGQRSYSIYLVHYPVVVALSCALHYAGVNTAWAWLTVVLPLCLLAALACGILFHRLVERHFLNAPLADRQGGRSATATNSLS